MKIFLNGDNVDLPTTFSLSELIHHNQLTGKRLAIEVNGVIIPRGEHTDYQLSVGDRVEIIHAIGGG